MRNLESAKRVAKEKGIANYDTLKISNASGKRFSIKSHSGKLINFGAYPFKDGTFIDHGDEKIRSAWKARHIKIMKEGKPAYLNPESPEYYAWNILW